MASRMLSDLEYRGSVRPITEEFNLASNFRHDDVMNAEFYRTSHFKQFYGGNILRLLRSWKASSPQPESKHLFIRKRVGYTKKHDVWDASTEHKYGYRGDNPAFYYLSPWEFCQWWIVDRLKSPTSDKRTEWTEEGIQYCMDNKDNRQPEAPKAGKHYVVIDSADLTSWGYCRSICVFG